MSTITETYQYGGGNEHEFVFSCRGRPFTALLSSFLPTPTSTLIDYELVKDLNLKMTDLQCRKFHYAGHKMRILGQVTTAVQTIKNGFTEGNFQFSAQVVLDLNKNLDTFSVAGHKMSKQLSQTVPVAADPNMADVPAVSTSTWSPLAAAPDVSVTPKPKRSPRKQSSTTKTVSPATSPSPASSSLPSTPQHRPQHPTSRSRPSPNFSPSSPIVLEPVSPRRAPPGFPTPIFGKDHIGKLPTCLPVQWDSMASPRSDNLRYFDKTFGGADKLSTEDEKNLLLRRYKDADISNYSDGNFLMEMSNGLMYRSGHGELKCNRVRCIQPGMFQQGVPNNCGFHRQWQFTDEFKPCGPQCRGAYCDCLSLIYHQS